MIDEIGKINNKEGKTLLRMWCVNVPKGERPLVNHCHGQFEIMCVLNGSGCYTVGKNEHKINTGDMFVFSSNEKHCITSVDSDRLIIRNIHFDPSYLWGSHYDRLNEEYSNFCFVHSDNFSCRITHDNSSVLYNLCDKIEEEFTSLRAEYHLMIKSLLNEIIITLIRNFSYAKDTPPVKRAHTKSIQKIISYIDEHLDEDLTLVKIADVVSLSPNYLSAVFRKTNGISLWDFIQTKRIDRAMFLISQKENTANIFDIALSCGFNNTANFNRAFRKQTAMTPSEYKKSVKLLI